MSRDNDDNSEGDRPSRKNSAVPSSRIRRVGKLGALATQVAGNVITTGAGQWLKGQRPALTSLILTPKNITNIANQLANMRGAAMKLGQLISMDSGDFLPPELASILARLRDDADPMPKSQLVDTLDEAWGSNWQNELLYFSFAPVAAASIGQVHKAITLDGKMLAIKVQYPGVKQSIDSDIDNIASLIKLSGLVPGSVDLNTLLTHAKQQLHEEANYHREAEMLMRYRQALGKEHAANLPLFIVPEVYSPLTTSNVLAMDFVNAAPLDALQEENQQTRDMAMTALMRLFFKEVFDFRLLQSDPNLANYQFNTKTKQWVLLDFGATREIPEAIANAYRELLISAAFNDKTSMLKAALSIGLVTPEHSKTQQQAVVDLGMEACEAIRWQGPYDFGQTDVILRLHEKGMALTAEHNFWHTPPADALFIHRKLGGLYLLAKRLQARIDMREAAKPWLAEAEPA